MEHKRLGGAPAIALQVSEGTAHPIPPSGVTLGAAQATVRQVATAIIDLMSIMEEVYLCNVGLVI